MDEVLSMQVSYLQDFLLILRVFDDCSDIETVEQIVDDVISNNPKYLEIVRLISMSCPDDFDKDVLEVFQNGTFSDKVKIIEKATELMMRDLGEDAINLVYSELIDGLKENELSFYQQLGPLNFILNANLPRFTRPFPYDENEILSDSVSISKEELLTIVADFLDYFDSTSVMCEKFLDLLSKRQIMIWDAFEEPPLEVVQKFGIQDFDDWMIQVEEDASYINGPFLGTLRDVFYLVHEFMHYLFPTNLDTDSFFFSEFVPILVEHVLYDYLLKKGYPVESLNKTMIFRDYEQRETISSSCKTIELMNKKLSGERIVEEDFVKVYTKEAYLKSIQGAISEDLSKELDIFFEDINDESFQNGMKLLKYQLALLDSSDFIETFLYIFAYLFSKDVYQKAKGKDGVLSKLNSIQSAFENSDMSLLYYLSYFELWNYYFMFTNDFSEYTIPSRIEDKQKRK